MTSPQVQQFVGRTAVPSEGSKVGKIGQVYLDERTGQPVWATVSTGLFGTRQSFAPIYGSRFDGDQVVLAASRDQVSDAPNIDADGPVTDDAMTRSQEQLRVGTEPVEAARARLRKYVVTENVSTTVSVSHEEVRVDREPVTGANRDAALSREPISEDEHEVTLRAERPVVPEEAVPVERVRLGTETVSETVRKEQIGEPGVDEGTK
jgi:uncharacterized protein (TIGR02271 family)